MRNELRSGLKGRMCIENDMGITRESLCGSGMIEVCVSHSGRRFLFLYLR